MYCSKFDYQIYIIKEINIINNYFLNAPNLPWTKNTPLDLFNAH